MRFGQEGNKIRGENSEKSGSIIETNRQDNRQRKYKENGEILLVERSGCYRFKVKMMD